jgi:SSS family solute:Na+ symporter
MMILAIGITLVVGSILIGTYLASRGTKMDVQEWSVGGRRFGTWLFWFLLVGETFTTFALLGASQGVFSGGAPGYYVLGTVALVAPIGYFLVPRIWRAGKVHGLTTMGDFFTARFNARWFGGLLTIFGIIALLLYTRVQLTGLSLILATLFGPDIPSLAYVFAGGVLVVIFVFIGGMRSAAFVAVVKDVLLVLMLLLVAAGAAHAAGVDGIGGLFDAVKSAHPDAATLPGIGGKVATNEWWWMSFLLLTPLGAFALPHAFQVSFTAKDATTIRKNQIIQPLYSLFYVFIVVIALAALVALPNLPAKQANGSLLIFVSENYPDWIIGLLAGCGVLVALVPTAVLMITASSMFTSNVIGVAKPALKRSLGATRVCVIVFTLLGVLITAFNSEALLTIMTGVYSAVGQLAPALFFAFLWRRATAVGLTVGAVTGGLIVALPWLGALVLTVFPPGTIVGVPALIINTILAVAVSLVTKAPPKTAIAVGMPDTATPVAAATGAHDEVGPERTEQPV